MRKGIPEYTMGLAMFTARAFYNVLREQNKNATLDSCLKVLKIFDDENFHLTVKEMLAQLPHIIEKFPINTKAELMVFLDTFFDSTHDLLGLEGIQRLSDAVGSSDEV